MRCDIPIQVKCRVCSHVWDAEVPLKLDREFSHAYYDAENLKCPKCQSPSGEEISDDDDDDQGVAL